MNRDEIDAFLAERRNAVLATVSRSGDPIQVPVWFDWHDGRIYISVTTQRGFFGNLRRHPRVAVCVDDHGHPVRTVLIRGEARIIDGDAQWPHVERIVAKYIGGEAGAARVQRLRQEPRVILEIAPAMITSWTPTPMDREVWRAPRGA